MNIIIHTALSDFGELIFVDVCLLFEETMNLLGSSYWQFSDR